MSREPTRVPRWLSERYGQKRVHVALFQHRSDAGGPWTTVAIMIPEASTQLSTPFAKQKPGGLEYRHSAIPLHRSTRWLPRLHGSYRSTAASAARAAAGGWALQ